MTQEELEAGGVPAGQFFAPGWTCVLTSAPEAVRGVVSAAISDIGKQEDPPGSNDGSDLAKFKTGGQPWCALAVSEWFREGRLDDGGCPWGVLASALAIKTWGTAHGARIPPSETQPGDVFVTMRTDIHGHVGLIVHVDGDRVYTVEGNSGNAVRGGSRTISSFTAVVRPVVDLPKAVV